MTNNEIIRKVVKQVVSSEQSEGTEVGARMRRSIGTSELKSLDPFLLLDENKAYHPASFPDHPRRGFETVTYMLNGYSEHEDFLGDRGILGPGDLQWMTAGRDSKEEVHGLQLWVNLPAKDKMCEPSYQDLKNSQIPRVTPEDGITIKVISGQAYGVTSPIHINVPVYYLDFKMEPNKSAYQILPAGFSTAFIYTLTGKLEVSNDGKLINAHTTVVFDKGENDKQSKIIFKTQDSPAHFILIAGKPINESIVQYGPFVMNDQEGIQKTFLDYRLNMNGFEKAKGWKSAISMKRFNSNNN